MWWYDSKSEAGETLDQTRGSRAIICQQRITTLTTTTTTTTATTTTTRSSGILLRVGKEDISLTEDPTIRGERWRNDPQVFKGEMDLKYLFTSGYIWWFQIWFSQSLNLNVSKPSSWKKRSHTEHLFRQTERKTVKLHNDSCSFFQDNSILSADKPFTWVFEAELPPRKGRLAHQEGASKGVTSGRGAWLGSQRRRPSRLKLGACIDPPRNVCAVSRKTQLCFCSGGSFTPTWLWFAVWLPRWRVVI